MTDAAIVIVGAGQAGLQVAISLREKGHAGPITLVGGEAHLPYHRPPLSKRGLAQALTADDLAIRNRDFIGQRNIELRLGVAAESIDRAARVLHLADGARLPYDTLVLATGSRPRRLALPGSELPSVLQLHGFADLQRLRALLPQTRRAVSVGGGFVGLEVAASLTLAGVTVTVIEAAPRLLSRVASPALSAHVAAAHLARGVAIRTAAVVTALSGSDRVTLVGLGSGEQLPADLVLVGIGAEAEDRLAVDAGLRTDRGILVDPTGRSSDPSIYAAGDCTRFDHPHYGPGLRLESVNNALDQARSVASAIVGEPVRSGAIPWFWSDQFDLRIQLAGLPAAADRSETVSCDEGFLRHFVRDGQLRAVEAVNAPRAFMAARRRIEAEAASRTPLQGAA